MWKKPRNGKYNATKQVVDGIEFDSKLEAFCYSQLKLFGIDTDRQVRFVLSDSQPVPMGSVFEKFGKARTLTIRKIEVVPDFVFRRNGKTIVIDTKGYRTPDSMLKFKLLFNNLTKEHECEFYFS